LPPAIDGEACFAASGSCIAVAGKNQVWFATGGKAARVFSSLDRGDSWTVSTTPVVSGVDSAGVFSITFKDQRNGYLVGGDYKKQSADLANAARSTDGGLTWKAVGRRPGGYRSAVAYLPGSSWLISVGESGADYSSDGGETWTSAGETGFHAVSVSSSRTGWAVGANGRISRIDAEGLIR